MEDLRKKDWGTIFNKSESERSEYDLVVPRKKGKIKDPGVLDRGQGCLLGQLAGDALGSLVEFMDPAAIEKKYPGGVRELHDGGTFNTIAGQPTDDSEMALMLARSILKTGSYDADEAARAYAFWYASHPFDMGTTTSRALSAISGSTAKNLFSIASKAASRDSQANGSLMRISPLGIWGHALSPDVLAGFARQDSSITHPHQVCRDACAVFPIAIARGKEPKMYTAIR